MDKSRIYIVERASMFSDLMKGMLNYEEPKVRSYKTIKGVINDIDNQTTALIIDQDCMGTDDFSAEIIMWCAKNTSVYVLVNHVTKDFTHFMARYPEITYIWRSSLTIYTIKRLLKEVEDYNNINKLVGQIKYFAVNAYFFVLFTGVMIADVLISKGKL